ncbi:septum formation initiator family protein [Persephonella sp.]|uniref:FtsB family cell division protein n=1 Tax=Persephonella sp. TaxID=2060922 RepID=UPI002623F96A|nr:septum formation initiator family protein [Persephonella sp.]
MDSVLLLITLGLFIYFSYVLFFGDRNIFKLIQKEKIKNSLQQEVTQLQLEKKILQDTIEYLKSDRFFIEKKAREDLGLMKKGEEIYVIIDKDTPKRKKEKRWIDKVIQKYQEFKLR